MSAFTHADQQRIWDEEHARPQVLLQMDAREASSGVTKFIEFLQRVGVPQGARGIEMGCGKGRNVIWLARKGFEMSGFDFSPSAIAEARRRVQEAGVDKTQFVVADATQLWPYESNSFDFAINCFATTDIESAKGRAFAVSELYRVLKPGGHLLAYLLSTDDEFHKEMITRFPSEQRNAFHHPTGKFEKTFDEEELRAVYRDFEIVRWERVEKTTVFGHKTYACKHFWLVLQKK
jgi:ubiquinone/menaquinone biosynthesis C-methylase UbiE